VSMAGRIGRRRFSSIGSSGSSLMSIEQGRADPPVGAKEHAQLPPSRWPRCEAVAESPRGLRPAKPRVDPESLGPDWPDVPPKY
jgi:hypothetical protein